MTKGGIDLNAANVDFMIKRDGKGIILPFLQQDIGMLNSIEGFVPNIIEIRPFIVQPVIRHSNDGGIKIKHLLTNA